MPQGKISIPEATEAQLIQSAFWYGSLCSAITHHIFAIVLGVKISF